MRNDDHSVDGYINLIGAVMNPMLRDDPAWLLSDAGRFWSGIAGLNAQTLYDMATRKVAKRIA